MSFRLNNTHTKHYRTHFNNQGKEKDSFLAHHFAQSYISQKERTSAFASKGSITAETALVLPIFFLAVLCLVYLLEMICIQTTMKSALRSLAKEIAKESYVNPVQNEKDMEQEMIDMIGEEQLDRSMVYRGSAGLHCRKTRILSNLSVIELSVRYQIKIPVLLFQIPVVAREETIRVKGWTGYEQSGFSSDKKQIVYITENGLVYHKDEACSYLELSIKSVPKSQLPNLRNIDGGKYYPCLFCQSGNSKDAYVYLTESGSRYHSSLGCSGLKRTVYAVELSEVYGRGGCSRCVK